MIHHWCEKKEIALIRSIVHCSMYRNIRYIDCLIVKGNRRVAVVQTEKEADNTSLCYVSSWSVYCRLASNNTNETNIQRCHSRTFVVRSIVHSHVCNFPRRSDRFFVFVSQFLFKIQNRHKTWRISRGKKALISNCSWNNDKTSFLECHDER